MTHAEMKELYELYALGVLEPELAAEIDRYFEKQWPECAAGFNAAVDLTAALAGTAEPVSPPSSLRERVIASVRPAKVPPAKPASRWIFAVTMLSAACLALVIFSIASQVTTRKMQQRLSALLQERDQLRSAVEILSRPETRSVQFGRTENVPHGRVLVSRNRGVVFVGSQLPQIGANQTFELWLIPNTGAPKPAGLFRPNEAGDSVNVSPTVAEATTKAVAVSIEPRQGSSAPTTTPILVVPVG